MAAYATREDLIPGRITGKVATDLTDDADSGEPNNDVIDAALVAASATIESYCRVRYVVPLQASEQIEELCLDLATYNLYKRRPRNMPETVVQAKEDAIAFLKDVAAGKAGLDQQSTTVEQSASTGSVASEKEQAFSDDKLSGYV